MPDADPKLSGVVSPAGRGASTGACAVPGANGGDPLCHMENLIRQQGDVVRFDGAFGPVFFFNHPDGVQAVLQSTNYVRTPLITTVLGQGLLASDGDWWRAQRRLMQPHFREQCLPAFGPVITGAAREMLARWESHMGTKEPLDVALEMRRLSLEVIVRAMFSAGLEGEVEALIAAFAAIMDDLGGISAVILQSPSHFRPSRNAEFRAAVETLDRTAFRLIQEHRNRDDQPRDLLTVLMHSKDATTGLPLTDRQLRDEVVTMLTAGHEASANVLAWVWHLLAENPAVDERLRAEVDRSLGGRVPTVEDLPLLPYTRMVLEETMRLYPPVWFMMRRAVVEGEIAGLRIPAGAFVLVSPYTTHRHQDFWEDPERFDPGRFSSGKNSGRHACAYLPFAGGRHHCLGHSCAMMENQLIVALITQRCRMQAIPGGRVEPWLVLSLRQQPGMRAVVTSRGSASVS